MKLKRQVLCLRVALWSSLNWEIFLLCIAICSAHFFLLSGDHDKPHNSFVNLSLFYWQDMVERYNLKALMISKKNYLLSKPVWQVFLSDQSAMMLHPMHENYKGVMLVCHALLLYGLTKIQCDLKNILQHTKPFNKITILFDAELKVFSRICSTV